MIHSTVLQSLNDARDTLSDFVAKADNIYKIDSAISQLAACFKNGGKVLSCGNGGSMCDAMHFAEELTGKFKMSRNPLPAIAISDPSHITCTANDYGFSEIFSRYVEAHGKVGDVLLAISTSGNSENVLKAAEVARKKGLKVIGLLGNEGGKIKHLCDIPIIVEQKTSERVQEVHIKIIHIIIDGVEKNLFKE